MDPADKSIGTDRCGVKSFTEGGGGSGSNRIPLPGRQGRPSSRRWYDINCRCIEYDVDPIVARVISTCGKGDIITIQKDAIRTVFTIGQGA
jgi:hypothetical protein